MKPRLAALLLIALALGAAYGIRAQAGGPPPPPPQSADGNFPGDRRPPPGPLFWALDTNHDGELSAEEIAAVPAILKALDKNGDGKLDRDELRPPFPPPGCPPPRE